MKDNIHLLLHYIAMVKWRFVFSLSTAVIGIVTQVGMTGIQKYIIDDVFIEKQYNKIWLVAAVYLGIIAVNFFIFVYLNHFIRISENKLKIKMFAEMLGRMQRFPVKKLQQERTGKMAEQLTGDISNLANYTLRSLPYNIQDLLHAIILSVILAWTSPIIFVITLTSALLFFVIARWMGPKHTVIEQDVTASRTQLSIATEEAISSTREVLAFHRQDWEKQKFDRFYTKYLADVKRKFRLDIVQGFFTDPILWGIQLVVIAYGGYLVMRDSMSIGTFVVMFHFSTQAIWVYFWLMHHFIGFSEHIAIFDRVRSVLESETVEEGTQDLNEPIDELKMQNVTFAYPGVVTPVLRDLSLHIPLGKTIAIVGKSGGGKSTIAQLLMRSFDPDAGLISVNGKRLQDIRRSDWFAQVSIVFQDSYLFPESIQTNLLMGAAHTEEEVQLVCSMMQIHDTIQSFPDGYRTEIGERGIQLSGGQRQRVVLSRALLRNTETLILDEATSALDYETERAVYRNLKAMRQGKTTIIIAHRLSTVQDADIIYVIDEGKIVTQGTHQELMNSGSVYVDLVAAGL